MGNFEKFIKNVIRYTLYATQSKGQILIELIIAIGLGTIIIASIFSLFVDIGQANLQSLEQTQGEKYVEEGVEALYSIREKSWNDLVNFSYPAHPVENSSVWELQNGSEILADNFTRQITMEPVYRNATSGEIVTSGGVIDPSTKKFTITISWQKPRTTTISKEIYLTRYLGNVNWTETTNGDFSSGTADQMEVKNDQGGELVLEHGEGEGDHTGNKFSVFEPSFTDNLDDANKKVSFRFTAQHTGDVDYIRIYVNDGHPTQPPKYRFGLQSDLNGKPSGVWLGKDHNAYKDYQIKTLGWKELELEHDAEIVKDTPYHLVVQYQSGQINPGKYINLRVLNPLNKIVPYDASADENRMTLWSEDDGATWTEINKTPVFILIPEEEGTVDYNNSEGNPYHTAFDGSVYGTNYKGEEFIYSDLTEFVSRVGAYVYLKKNNPNQPQDDLYIVIKDMTTGQTLADKIFVNRNDVSVDYNLKEAIFDPALPMVQGHIYQLYFYSNGTAANRAYQIGVAENEDFDPYNLINYLADKAQYIESNNSGNSWNKDKFRDTMFRFSTVASTGYFSEGNYESSSFDAGSLVSFNRILWTETINPGITNVEFQIATNNDNSTWNFVGPDGTAATRFTNSASGSIPLNSISGRYFRYKNWMTTSANTQTPTVYDVTVNYSP